MQSLQKTFLLSAASGADDLTDQVADMVASMGSQPTSDPYAEDPQREATFESIVLLTYVYSLVGSEQMQVDEDHELKLINLLMKRILHANVRSCTLSCLGSERIHGHVQCYSGHARQVVLAGHGARAVV